jgi:tRNA (adenine22-N1)-methyltransferase
MHGVARRNRAPIRPKVLDVRGEKGLQLNTQTLSMRLADIGSDHGYLPVALTPFRSAERTVRESGLEQRITVRLANGLAAIERGVAVRNAGEISPAYVFGAAHSVDG